MMKPPECQWCLRNYTHIVVSQSAAANNFNYYTVGGRYDNIFMLLRDLHSSRTILIWSNSLFTKHTSWFPYFTPSATLFLLSRMLSLLNTIYQSLTSPSWCTLTGTLSLSPFLIPKDKNVLLSPFFFLNIRTFYHFHILLQIIFE